MNLLSAFKICTDIASPIGSPRYYSLRSLPEDKRFALTALYAFEKSLFDITLQKRDLNVALTKLNWWREEILKLFDNTARHPITLVLQEARKKFSLHPQRFQNIANAIESDLQIETYATENDLLHFFNRTKGEVEIMAAMILKENPLDSSLDKSIEGFRHLGCAEALLHNLTRFLTKKGKVYTSSSYHASAGWHPVFITMQINHIETELNAATQALTALNDLAFQPSLLFLKMQQTILAKIKSRDPLTLQAKHCSLSPVRLWWMMVKSL